MISSPAFISRSATIHQVEAICSILCILKQFGVPIPNGVVILDLKEINDKSKKLNSNNLILKAQIHAGGRGKAGGIKLIDNIKDVTE